MTAPPPALFRVITEVQATLAVLTGLVAERGPALDRTLRLIDAVNDTASLRGNRPASAAVTWDDLQMMLANALRACLQELEAP